MAGKTATLEATGRSKSSLIPPSITRRGRVQPMTSNEWKSDERFRIGARGNISSGPIRVNVDVGLSENIEKKFRGVNNLTSIAWLSRGLELSKAVARIRTPEGSGTGFLIGPNLLLTNKNVIPDSQTAAESFADFNYQSGDFNNHQFPGLNYQKSWNSRLAPVRRFQITSTGFCTNGALGYSIVQIEGNPAEEFGFFDAADHGIPVVNDYVTIIQHPLGGVKQISLTDNKVARVDGDFLQYVTETEPGTSGAPIFDQDWRIVALQQKSGGLQGANGRSHYINQGVLINAIVRDARDQLDFPDQLHEIIFSELWRALVNVVHAEQSFVAYIPIFAENGGFRRALADWIALNLTGTETEDHQEIAPLLAASAGVAAGAAIRHWGRFNQLTVESPIQVTNELVKLVDDVKVYAELPSQVYYGVLSKVDDIKRMVRRVVDEVRHTNGSAEASKLDQLAFDQLGYVPAAKLPILATGFLAGVIAGAAAYDGGE